MKRLYLWQQAQLTVDTYEKKKKKKINLHGWIFTKLIKVHNFAHGHARRPPPEFIFIYLFIYFPPSTCRLSLPLSDVTRPLVSLCAPKLTASGMSKSFTGSSQLGHGQQIQERANERAKNAPSTSAAAADDLGQQTSTLASHECSRRRGDVSVWVKYCLRGRCGIVITGGEIALV